MITSGKLKDARRLLKAKAYIYIDERVSSFSGDFKDLEVFSVLHALTQVKANLAEVTKHYKEKYYKKGAKPARKSVKRSK